MYGFSFLNNINKRFDLNVEDQNKLNIPHPSNSKMYATVRK